MAQHDSYYSFPNKEHFVKAEPALHFLLAQLVVAATSCHATHLRDCSSFNDRPDPKRCSRTWGTLPIGVTFEITLAIELLPDSVREWRS
jgi:hypothetical protein